MKKKEVEEELEKLSPFLSNLKKEDKEGFSVPNDYFSRFEDRLMHRIDAEQVLERATGSESGTPTLSKARFWNFLKGLMYPQYAIGFSTTILLIVFGVYFANDETELPLENNSLEGLLAEAGIDNYIYNNIEEFTTDEILTVLALDEIETIQKKIVPVVDATNEGLSKSVEDPEESSMDKVLETINADDLLDNLTVDDLEGEEEDIFM